MGLSPREWLDLWGWGGLSADDKPHLRYPSVWRWARAENVTFPLPAIADAAERRQRQREYAELWEYLFVKHLAGLPEDEQRAFQERRHPSQSHDHGEAVEPVAEQLRAELASRDIVAEVSVDRYCDGRTVLSVPLPEWPLDGQWPDDLNFFKGYDVHIGRVNPSNHPT